MEHSSETIFQKLKEDLTSYIELKLEYLKLCSYERIGKVSAVLCYGIIWIFLIIFVNLFIFLALGFYLGSVLNSLGLGFACIAVIYLIIVCLVRLFKEKVKKRLENVIIKVLAEDDYNNISDDEKTPNSSGKTVE